MGSQPSRREKQRLKREEYVGRSKKMRAERDKIARQMINIGNFLNPLFPIPDFEDILDKREQHYYRTCGIFGGDCDGLVMDSYDQYTRTRVAISLFECLKSHVRRLSQEDMDTLRSVYDEFKDALQDNASETHPRLEYDIFTHMDQPQLPYTPYSPARLSTTAQALQDNHRKRALLVQAVIAERLKFKACGWKPEMSPITDPNTTNVVMVDELDRKRAEEDREYIEKQNVSNKIMQDANAVQKTIKDLQATRSDWQAPPLQK